MKRVSPKGQDLSVGCRRAARMGLPKTCPDGHPGREYPKLYESHAGRTAGSPLYGASGAVLLFLLAQSLETVKIKIHRRDVLWAK